jgi:hypothetical protein
VFLLIPDARIEVVACCDVSRGGDDGEEQCEAGRRQVHGQDVEGNLVVDVRAEIG